MRRGQGGYGGSAPPPWPLLHPPLPRLPPPPPGPNDSQQRGEVAGREGGKEEGKQGVGACCMLLAVVWLPLCANSPPSLFLGASGGVGWSIKGWGVHRAALGVAGVWGAHKAGCRGQGGCRGPYLGNGAGRRVWGGRMGPEAEQQHCGGLGGGTLSLPLHHS